MKNFVLFLVGMCATLVVSSNTNAAVDMMALEAGFKWNTVSLSGADSTKQVIGFQLGGSAAVNFAPSVALRTGLFYTERPFSSDFTILGSTVTYEGKLTYFEVPLQFMYRFEDYAGFYIGPSLAVNLSNEFSKPSGAKMTEVKSLVVPITIGAVFKFAPQMGANIFFETISGDLAKDVGSSKAIGANFLLTFD